MAATCSLSRCISLPVLVFLDFCAAEKTRVRRQQGCTGGAVFLVSLWRQSRWQPPGRAAELGPLRDRPAGRLRVWGPAQGNEAAKVMGWVGLGLRDAVWAYLGGHLLLVGLAGLVALVSTGHGWCFGEEEEGVVFRSRGFRVCVMYGVVREWRVVVDRSRWARKKKGFSSVPTTGIPGQLSGGGLEQNGRRGCAPTAAPHGRPR